MQARVVGAEDCQPDGFRWLTLKKIRWEDPLGRQRVWESAERTSRRGAVDGVAIVARIVRQGQTTVLPVLKQYRPPIANYCLELPAGLIDAGESAAQAAVRELKEETGYTGRVQDVTPICVSDPGMSNANMQYVVLTVDGDAPENRDVKQQLEDGEFIEVELVPWDGLMAHLMAEMEGSGCDVDARLLSYAFGLEHGTAAAAAAAAEAAAATAGEAAEAGAATSSGTAAEAVAAQPGAASDRSSRCSVDGSKLGSRSGSTQLESSASTGPRPFGSPILSVAQGSSGQPPAIFLDGQGSPAAGALAAAPAPAPAAASGCSATGAAGKQQLGNTSSSGGSNAPRQQGSILHSSRDWLLFAAGVAAGSAGCCLLLASSNGARQ